MIQCGSQEAIVGLHSQQLVDEEMEEISCSDSSFDPYEGYFLGDVIREKTREELLKMGNQSRDTIFRTAAEFSLVSINDVDQEWIANLPLDDRSSFVGSTVSEKSKDLPIE